MSSREAISLRDRASLITRLLLAGFLLFGLCATPDDARSAPPSSAPAGIAIASGLAAASTMTMTPADLAALPMVQVSVAFATAKGRFQARFAGPLLWTVLTHAGAVDPVRPRRQAGQTILLTGRDGYAAALAMGEVSPDFEGKAIILAESMNGQPLTDGFRLVVPGDRKGARNVRDVVRITITRG